jgi:prepilin-type N-terminal cleavage/methylation domain-containing protein
MLAVTSSSGCLPAARRGRTKQRSHPSHPYQQGFSMIEALIATAIIGGVAIGVIPLFSRAISDNLAGSDYTRVSNYSKSEEEDFAREPFANYTTIVPSGQTQSQVVQYIDPTSKQWVTVANLAAVPQNPNIVWTRTITYKVFNASDMDDDQLYNNPVSGGANPTAIQVVEATVQVQAISKIGPTGGRRSTTIRLLKAF